MKHLFFIIALLALSTNIWSQDIEVKSKMLLKENEDTKLLLINQENASCNPFVIQITIPRGVDPSKLSVSLSYGKLTKLEDGFFRVELSCKNKSYLVVNENVNGEYKELLRYTFITD